MQFSKEIKTISMLTISILAVKFLIGKVPGKSTPQDDTKNDPNEKGGTDNFITRKSRVRTNIMVEADATTLKEEFRALNTNETNVIRILKQYKTDADMSELIARFGTTTFAFITYDLVGCVNRFLNASEVKSINDAYKRTVTMTMRF